MTTQLTDKQQRAMEQLERARSEGMALSEYFRAHGVAVREIYDALAALRRKGVLPRATPRARSSKSAFVAVQVSGRSSPATPVIPASACGAIVCRVLIGGTTVIECAEWPPASWLAALPGWRADAAS
jgi:hypothetical protein